MKPRLGMPRALTAAVAAGLLAVPLGLAFAGPAQAATGRSDACWVRACGSATATWVSGGRTIQYSQSVNDWYCNGRSAFVFVRIAFVGGGTVDRPRLTDGAECNDIYSRQSGLSYTAPSGRLIAGFWAVTGDSGGAMVGTWADNPLT